MKEKLIRLAIAWLIITIFLNARAQIIEPIPKTVYKSKPNCIIRTTTKLKSGEVEKNEHKLKVLTKKKCESVTAALGQNFTPDSIAEVEARMIWKGK